MIEILLTLSGESRDLFCNSATLFLTDSRRFGAMVSSCHQMLILW